MTTRQAPALDRRGILGIASGSRSTSGIWVSGTPTQHVIWYMLKEWEIGIAVETFGNRQLADVEICTRYRRDVIQEALGGDVGVSTGRAFVDWYLELEGVRYEIMGAEEMPDYGRRRFMKIEGARST